MNFFTTKRITRAGIIAALYVVLTLPFASISFGPVQARISEALTVLPLFYVEAIPALFIGCMISNIIGYGVYDIIIGSFATLIAAVATYFIGKFVRNFHAAGILGILPPVISNALLVPWIIFLYDGVLSEPYFVTAATVGAGELLVVATLGLALYYTIGGLRKKGVGVMLG